MTYCLGITTRQGLVLAADSRTNAGYDQVNICRKMHAFVQSGEKVLVLLASGNLSSAQSALTLLRRQFEHGEGLASAASLYDAARVVGEQLRRVAELDREAFERAEIPFNVHFILGGQVRGEAPGLVMIYPQGNPLQAGPESPYLQIGETKYGKPILDRGIRFEQTTLAEAAKYAILSLDSTMKSNVSVGPPIDLLVYPADEFSLSRWRRFAGDDPDVARARKLWERALRRAVARLPEIRFEPGSADGPGLTGQTGMVVREGNHPAAS